MNLRNHCYTRQICLKMLLCKISYVLFWIKKSCITDKFPCTKDRNVKNELRITVWTLETLALTVSRHNGHLKTNNINCNLSYSKPKVKKNTRAHTHTQTAAPVSAMWRKHKLYIKIWKATKNGLWATHKNKIKIKNEA